jgi:AraC-like DNA-binding protein
MLPRANAGILGKIAAAVDDAVAARRLHGASMGTVDRDLAAGDGWRVADVICTSGPHDRRFEEQHAAMSVGVVVAGTFQHRSSLGDHLLTPGAFLLGNAGQCFECGHDHATGDRCVAFHFEPELLERVASASGARRPRARFGASRIPPRRETAPIVARAASALAGAIDVSWEELAIETAAVALPLSLGLSSRGKMPGAAAIARVTETVRRIERDPAATHALDSLAAEAGQSAFHYLRTFRQLTGITPHQFVLRARLRAAAARLVADDVRVIDVALDAGFGDLSNFNRAFRAEFRATPSEYQASARARRLERRRY